MWSLLAMERARLYASARPGFAGVWTYSKRPEVRMRLGGGASGELSWTKIFSLARIAGSSAHIWRREERESACIGLCLNRTTTH